MFGPAPSIRPCAGIGAHSDCGRGGAGRGRRGAPGVWSPRPTGATLVVRSGGPMYLRHGFRRPNFVPKFGASVMGIGPYGEKGKLPRPPGPAAHSGAYAARMGGMGRERGRDHPPKGPSTSDNPSVTAEPCQLPLHKGALGTGDADCHVAPLLAMTVLILCHSEEAQRADVGIRPFYDGRGFGPPYLGHGLRRPNSVPKFGASVKSSCPTGDCSLVEREPLGRGRGLFFLPFPGRLGGSGAWGTGCFFGGCRRSGLRRTPPPGGRHRR